MQNPEDTTGEREGQHAMPMETIVATEPLVRTILTRFPRASPIHKRLWARTDHDRITFWLLTEPISDEQEMTLYDVNRLIYARVPDARFDFIVVNPAMFDDTGIHFDPPHGAQEITLD
jgi:hypothetical protein